MPSSDWKFLGQSVDVYLLDDAEKGFVDAQAMEGLFPLMKHFHDCGRQMVSISRWAIKDLEELDGK
ncbi:hypothetical protein [Streptococcus himalayensis]|uniref:Uncharacterized protein n=1 Tax=Streptococcus himalayensis TaxID=1888195 RepID=A0A917A7F3_9STRE|nr:hypothetical protein [Streptococcus himalayensis]GGE31751.1 hypothetical protein GCM10011510_11330 [Streptococcus himalayensis]